MPADHVRRAWLIAFGLAGFLLFGYAAWVQLNDPDPVPWVVMYGAAALACLSVFRRAPARLVPAAVAAVALAWSAVIFAGLERFPAWADLTASRPMVGDYVEEAREALGLLLAGAWVGTLAALGAGRSAPDDRLASHARQAVSARSRSQDIESKPPQRD
jgi:uncharacterized membrane protein YedE/YeeE